MALNAGHIEALIRAAIPDAAVTLSDLRGDGRHYAAYIVSATFAGMNRLDQHRMVYKSLEGLKEDDLQSLAIQTAVPEGKGI